MDESAIGPHRAVPRWAIWVARIAVGLAAAILLLCLFVAVEDLSYRGEKMDGLGAGIAAMVAVITGVVALPWSIFLWRKHMTWFCVALAISILVLAIIASLGLR